MVWGIFLSGDILARGYFGLGIFWLGDILVWGIFWSGDITVGDIFAGDISAWGYYCGDIMVGDITAGIFWRGYYVRTPFHTWPSFLSITLCART